MPTLPFVYTTLLENVDHSELPKFIKVPFLYKSPEKFISPTTSNVFKGIVVPIPTLPPVVKIFPIVLIVPIALIVFVFIGI